MDVVLVISHYPDPRINKRIQSAKETGASALVFWDRETVKLGDLVHVDIENIKISVNAYYSNPLKRILPTIKFAMKALKQIKRLQPKCLYVTNVDMLLIASLYTFGRQNKPKIIYEVADLNKLIADDQKGIRKIIKGILISLENRMCRNICTLILTSEKFYDFYYYRFVPKSKLLFMPNMPNLNSFENYRRKETGKFTVGFIGAVRYKDQMKMLIDTVEECNIAILFAGAGLDNEIESITKNKPLVTYYGKYDYDKEIADLYGKVDCVYAVYDADLNNVKIALPNKLYEAIYCELPIIVAKGTYLAELVENMGVGVSVSHNDPRDLRNVLVQLATDKEYYHSLVTNCIAHKHEINAEIYNQKLQNTFKSILKGET